MFPDFAPGNFTWDDDVAGWVWTTFNSWQWDLNWANPDVLCEFVAIILNLANRGVDCLRLDAIAFIWKRLGTDCQNQPEVHAITQVLRAAARIAAPAVIFKAEAIVAPSQLVAYLGQGPRAGRVSDIAYHNSLMVQIWSALASRDARLMAVALGRFRDIPTTTGWATYLRCHDDIGWAIDDDDCAAIGWNGWAHRGFLSDFYVGDPSRLVRRGRGLPGEPDHRGPADLGVGGQPGGAWHGAHHGAAADGDRPGAVRLRHGARVRRHPADLHGRRAGAAQRRRVHPRA